MITSYPLEWIDSLILQTLNPKKTNISGLSQNDLALIAENLSKESHKIQIQLKNEIFSLQKKRQIRLLVRKYHSTLVYLLDNVIEHQKNDVLQTGILPSIIDSIIRTLDDLILFVENRYSNYLSLDERVPIPYMLVSKKEIQLKIEKLKKKKDNNIIDKNILEIVFVALSTASRNKSEYKITYREIFYQKELLKQLDALKDAEEQSGFYSAIDELLIEMNFNYQPYISYFINQIEERLIMRETFMDKINEVLFYYKEYNQLLSNEKIMFDPAKQNVRYVLDNWFREEINYLKNRIEVSKDSRLIEGKTIKTFNISDSKIECDLSIDQMALILRATDEARVIKVRSMNHFFKMIVPHLSTPFKKDLSYQSVRSKSYSPEERDKEIAVKILEKIINKIQSY